MTAARGLGPARKAVDLDNIIELRIDSGSVLEAEENEESLEDVKFTVSLVAYSSDSIELKLEFDDPLAVSIGDEPDILHVTFIDR